MSRALNILGISILFIIVFFLSAWGTVWWATSGKTVAAPDIEGKNVVDALKEVGRIGLDLRVIREEYDPVVPRNEILTQYPKAGTELKIDRNIRVVLSLGMRDIAVPDVRRIPLRKAELILKQNGMAPGRITRIHAQEEKEAVLSQNPMPLAVSVQQNSVDLLVSVGPHPVESRMPDVIGMDFSKAVTLLESSGLVIGNVRYEEYAGVEGNRIINQSPLHGYPTSRGKPIALVVRKKAEAPPGATVTRTPFTYRIPFGFLPVKVDVFVRDRQGRRRVYHGRKFSGTLLELTLELSGGAVVEVHLNGKKVHSREY